MNETFGEKNFYYFKVDKNKNHIFLHAQGLWKGYETTPQYINNMKKALSEVQPGFTLLVEAEQMKPPKLVANKMLKEGQRLASERGIKKTAVVMASDQLLKVLTLNVVSKLSKIQNQKVFRSMDEASRWLQAD